MSIWDQPQNETRPKEDRIMEQSKKTVEQAQKGFGRLFIGRILSHWYFSIPLAMVFYLGDRRAGLLALACWWGYEALAAYKPTFGDRAGAYLRKMMDIARTWIIISGLAGFSLFILEEAHQQCVFASWFAEDANRPDLIIKSAQLAEVVTKTGQRLVQCIGWVNPLAYIVYRDYFMYAAPHIIETMRAKVDDFHGYAAYQPAVMPQDDNGDNVPPLFKGAISHLDAHRYIGVYAAVLLPVEGVARHEKVAMARTSSSFSLVAFPSDPAYNRLEELTDSWVVAQGLIQEYNGKPQIVVTDWGQIVAQKKVE